MASKLEMGSLRLLMSSTTEKQKRQYDNLMSFKRRKWIKLAHFTLQQLKVWSLIYLKNETKNYELYPYLLVTPSAKMSDILQQEDRILVVMWSTIRT